VYFVVVSCGKAAGIFWQRRRFCIYTLGIQLAPSAVGAYAYLSMTTGTPDIVAQCLIGYALFQALVLIRLLPWIAKQPFSASYWAFTFGASALASSIIRFQIRGGSEALAATAPYLFAIANLIIGGIAVGTVVLMLRGRLLPPPLITMHKP
jgi:tellurite resistance protein